MVDGPEHLAGAPVAVLHDQVVDLEHRCGLIQGTGVPGVAARHPLLHDVGHCQWVVWVKSTVFSGPNTRPLTPGPVA
ncbi:hypothetical protein GCM10027610_030110 [Dactylosporangium cerinum]